MIYVTTTGNTFTACNISATVSNTAVAVSTGSTCVVVGNWIVEPPDAPPAGVREPRRPPSNGGPARLAVDG